MNKEYRILALKAAVSLVRGARKAMSEGKEEDAFLIMGLVLDIMRNTDPIPRVICEC